MKTILIITFHFFALFSFADAWDNLTREEAEKVVAELEKNPFIFDYCDCCDHAGDYAAEIYLLKVIETEIITCEWDATFYSVRYTAEKLVKVDFGPKGANISSLSLPLEKNATGLIYMNYTWVMNPKSQLASPFFDILPYHYYVDGRSCMGPFQYPSPPALQEIIKVKGYKKWYKRAMR